MKKLWIFLVITAVLSAVIDWDIYRRLNSGQQLIVSNQALPIQLPNCRDAPTHKDGYRDLWGVVLWKTEQAYPAQYSLVVSYGGEKDSQLPLPAGINGTIKYINKKRMEISCRDETGNYLLAYLLYGGDWEPKRQDGELITAETAIAEVKGYYDHHTEVELYFMRNGAIVPPSQKFVDELHAYAKRLSENPN